MHLFEKYIETGGHAWGPSSTLIHSSVLDKVAGACHTPDSLLKTIEGLRERPEGVYVLLTALGAYEYWGVNRNGDAFPEWSLKSMPPPEDVLVYLRTKVRDAIPGFVIPSQKRYGTITFETDAHVFTRHVNKDPLNAIGDVVAAAYNEHMHRSELIVFIYEARAPDVVRSLRDGVDVPFSMGARLPFDVCSRCFNIARNRQQYCRHLREMLNQTSSDGQKTFSHNWFPLFFDISEVIVPADRGAWSMRKIAGVRPDQYGFGVSKPSLLVDPTLAFTKVASVLGGTKTSSMVKNSPSPDSEMLGSAPISDRLLRFVRDQVVRDSCDSDDISDPQVDSALKHEGLGRVLSALALAGIILKPTELGRAKSISGEEVPKSLDLGNVPAKLIKIVRVHMPRRSMRDPEFSGRRMEKKASAVFTNYESEPFGADYRCYLELLRSSMESIVKEATTAKARVLLDPDWIGRSLFKIGASAADGREWIPFMAGATRHRWVEFSSTETI